MKKTIRLFFIFLTTLLLSGCAVTKSQNSIVGQFSGRTLFGGIMTLSLNSDETFDFNWRNVDYTGNWEVLKKNHILLKFDEITDLSILLGSGVILDRERTVKFINKNKVLMLPSKKDVLRRTK